MATDDGKRCDGITLHTSHHFTMSHKETRDRTGCSAGVFTQHTQHFAQAGCKEGAPPEVANR